MQNATYRMDKQQVLLCIAQGTVLSILWHTTVEKNMKKIYFLKRILYMYDWITLLYSRNQPNTVNQLYLNWKTTTHTSSGKHQNINNGIHRKQRAPDTEINVKV